MNDSFMAELPSQGSSVLPLDEPRGSGRESAPSESRKNQSRLTFTLRSNAIEDGSAATRQRLDDTGNCSTTEHYSATAHVVPLT